MESDRKIKHHITSYDEDQPNRKRLNQLSQKEEYLTSLAKRPIGQINTAELFSGFGKFYPKPMVVGDPNWIREQEKKKYEELNQIREEKKKEELNIKYEMGELRTVIILN